MADLGTTLCVVQRVAACNRERRGVRACRNEPPHTRCHGAMLSAPTSAESLGEAMITEARHCRRSAKSNTSNQIAAPIPHRKNPSAAPPTHARGGEQAGFAPCDSLSNLRAAGAEAAYPPVAGDLRRRAESAASTPIGYTRVERRQGSLSCCNRSQRTLRRGPTAAAHGR